MQISDVCARLYYNVVERESVMMMTLISTLISGNNEILMILIEYFLSGV